MVDVFAVFVLTIVASSAAFALKKYYVASNREAQYAELDFTYSSNISSYEVMFIINLWCEYVRINYA